MFLGNNYDSNPAIQLSKKYLCAVLRFKIKLIPRQWVDGKVSNRAACKCKQHKSRAGQNQHQQKEWGLLCWVPGLADHSEWIQVSLCYLEAFSQVMQVRRLTGADIITFVVSAEPYLQYVNHHLISIRPLSWTHVVKLALMCIAEPIFMEVPSCSNDIYIQ